MNKDTKANTNDENIEEVEKFFDEENYNTLIVEEDKFKSTKKAKLEDLLDLLLDENRDRKEEALNMLKAEKEKAQVFLLHIIHETDNEDHLALLLAACWECGLDFSPYLVEFVQLCIDCDFMCAVEACTVIESMEGKLDNKVLSDCINLLQNEIKKKNEKELILTDLAELLLSRRS